MFFGIFSVTDDLACDEFWDLWAIGWQYFVLEGSDDASGMAVGCHDTSGIAM